MKSITVYILVILVAGCNQSDSIRKNADSFVDTAIVNKPADTLPQKPSIPKKQDDPAIYGNGNLDTSLLMSASEEILKLIKKRDYRKFVTFIHPLSSIRFSPYAYIDTIKDKVLSAEQLLHLVKQNKKINWNSSWDEKTELLTVDTYFKKFIYDVDFLNADLKSINDYHSQGTDLNNINEVYAGCDVVEFFFPGFEKKYEGLDFRALRLVYKTKNSQLFLIGIVHDKWTP